jgi:DNA transformation protein
MGYSKAYREEVEEKLSAVKMISSRAMFGGVGIYADDYFFALIAEDKLYFKVDDTNRADYVERESEAFHPYDSPHSMGYFELPPGVIDDPVELAVWVDKSLKVAQSKKKKRR